MDAPLMRRLMPSTDGAFDGAAAHHGNRRARPLWRTALSMTVLQEAVEVPADLDERPPAAQLPQDRDDDDKVCGA